MSNENKQNKTSKISDFVNQKIVPPIMKFVNTKGVKAMTDGMVSALPFIIIGSVFLIFANFPVPVVSHFFAKTGWSVFSIKLIILLSALLQFGQLSELHIHMLKMKD